MVTQGSKRKGTKRQEIEAASLLRPRSKLTRPLPPCSLDHSVTEPAQIQGEGTGAPPLDDRSVKGFETILTSPHMLVCV